MYRVIIAEDEHLIRRELRIMVDWQRLGLEIVGEAEDGLHALVMVDALKPHILITDIRMPGMDGLSLIARLHERHDTQCIIISGHMEFDYAIKAIHLGAADYLLKPIDEVGLGSVLSRIVARLDVIKEAKIITDVKSQALSSSERDARSNDYMSRALEYIDLNSEKEINVRLLASQLFISQGYLSKLFVRNTGLRFTEYVNHHRILKAVELLQTTDLKIYEIADRVGYSEYRYFCTMFRSILRMSPAQFKEKLGASRSGSL